MKRIEIVQTFKHGGQIFHAGEVRMVTPEDCGYFCGLGWAKAEDVATGTPDTSPKTLEVHGSKIGQSAANIGVK